MLTITLYALGTIKEPYLQLGIQEFLKRLKTFANINIIEIKESSSDQPTIALKEEAERLEKALPKDGYRVVFAMEGMMFDSLQLAQNIDKIQQNHSHLILIIGGSHGVAESVKKHAHALWSFSSLTFPHQLFRLLVLEQLYRGMSILAHHPYHK
jgi:23S rRNA (pseudouridine1915-N3)-methyltransferase